MKRILITGASKGIGRAIAIKLADKDSHILIHGRNTKDLAETESLIKDRAGKVTQILADFSTSEGAEKVVHEVGDEPIDVVINNAGITMSKPMEQLTLDNWNKVVAVNITAPFIITHSLLRQMKKGSSIVNIMSGAAKTPFPNFSAYCMSKYGLRGFTDTIREELRPRGIRVIGVYPGSVDTPIWKTIPGEWDRERMLKPQDVANSVAYALSCPPSATVEDIRIAPTGGRL